MFLTVNHICSNNLPLWQSMTKPQQKNEYMREVINHSTHIHLLNTIKSIPTQTLEKICKKRVHGKKNFKSLYFLNTLNKTHHSILMWNRNKRLYIINKKHVHKEKKESTHVEISERTVITTLSYIYIYIYIYNIISTRFAITKWSSDDRNKGRQDALT